VQNYCGCLQKDCISNVEGNRCLYFGFWDAVSVRSVEYFEDVSNRFCPWITVLLEKLIVSQLVTISPHFVEPDGSSSYSQQPAACPCPNPDDFSIPPPLRSSSLILIFFFHLRLGLQVSCSIFPTNILPLFPNPATCPVYFIPLHLIPLKITNFHTVKFSPLWRFLTFPPLRSPKFLPQHSLHNILSLCSSLNMSN